MVLRLLWRNAGMLLRLKDKGIPGEFKDAASWLIPTGFVVAGASGCLYLFQGQQPLSHSYSGMSSPQHHTFYLSLSSQTEDSLFHPSLFQESHQRLKLQNIRWDGIDALSKAQGDVLALLKALQMENLTVIDQPRVTMLNDQLSIRFSLSEKTNVMHFILDTIDALPKHPNVNISVKNTGFQLRMDEGTVLAVLHFDCVGPTTSIAIQITAPLVSEGCPEVELVKKSPLNDGDLMLLDIILRSAAKAYSDKGQQFQSLESWLQSKPDDDLFLELENRIQEFFKEFPFSPHMRQFDWPIIHDHQHSQIPNGFHEQHNQTKEISPESIVKQLESMGAIVYAPNPTEKLDWGVLSGYTDQKRRIEDGLLLPLLHPDVSDSIVKRTRKHYASNRPRGVLFEGDPGTGKTSSARIIASQTSIHMIYIPLESILSKWYGESEKLLSEAFKAADQLGGAIVFFDEIETLGTKRTDDIHEASRRLLSVLLREMDGFDTKKRIIVIGATNRKQDMDPALLSRFDSIIRFDLPDEQCRSLIFNQYAQQLTQKEIDALSSMGEGMSGRDIRDVCELTERMWASRIVRGEVEEGQLPGFQEYLDAITQRQTSFKSK